jgi:tellurite resistance protein TerC
MVAHLPNNQPIPWPTKLKRFGDKLHPILGDQQTAALRIGLLGAYAGRALLLFLATIIIRNPWIKMIGAAYLIYLAFENLGVAPHKDLQKYDSRHDLSKKSFWGVVLSVEIADLVFSLDNVVTAVALSEHLWVVMVGVAIGMLVMRFAAGIFSVLVEKAPILQKAAFLLILVIGTEIIAGELFQLHFPTWIKFSLSISVIGISLLYANSHLLHRSLSPIVQWAQHGFYHLKTIIDWMFEPFQAILGELSSAVRPPAKQAVPVNTTVPRSHTRELLN